MQYGGAFGMCEYIAYVSSGVCRPHARTHMGCDIRKYLYIKYTHHIHIVGHTASITICIALPLRICIDAICGTHTHRLITCGRSGNAN